MSFDTRASDLRVGDYCLIDGEACCIQQVQRFFSRHTKLRVFADDSETILSADQPVLIPTFESERNLQRGDYCLIEGFPCQIQSISRSQSHPKCDHYDVDVVGVGLLDRQKHDGTFNNKNRGKILVPIVQTKFDSDGLFAGYFASPIEDFKVESFWVDERLQPEDENGHFGLTLVLSTPTRTTNKQVTTDWVISKKAPCYQIVLRDRERQERAFLAFLSTTRRAESTSAALGQVEALGILRAIFDFVMEEGLGIKKEAPPLCDWKGKGFKYGAPCTFVKTEKCKQRKATRKQRKTTRKQQRGSGP